MKIKLLLTLMILGSITLHAQVGVGTTTPNAELDITSTTRGLLIPRVSLTNLTVQAPVTNPQGGNIPISTLIYHDGTNSITTGFYYWDGTQWVLLTTGESSDWTILGNSGTNPTTNFIGTTDAQDFVIRTNNTEKARIMSAGNVGIGIAAPIAKTHIYQPATATEDVFWAQNLGTGGGLTIFQANTGASLQAIYLEQDGTNAVFSRGIEAHMGTTNPATGSLIFHSGIGRGHYVDLSNTANASTGSLIFHSGTGVGNYTELSNTANANEASSIIHAGTGLGQLINHTGTGTGQFINLTNTTSTATVSSLDHDGLGRGQQITLNNATNNLFGLGVFHSGTGNGIYSEAVGNAVTGYSSGITSTAGTFVNTNANADTNSLGLFVNYSGIGGGTAGGGNAAEISHFGTNGNAVDIFMGDPTAGATPSTSEYSALTVSHSATGTSPTAGRIKAAISASNASADPTIFVSNTGIDNGDGMQVFVTPNTNAATTGIYSQSVSGALGVGVYGTGGDIGVIGQSNGGVNGVFAFGEVGGTGAKPFTIDHPLDPENKVLRHFAIESNEVLNMYRGIAKIGPKGIVVVKLPKYFDAININITYQLTPIGTNVQPYIAKEQANNKFSIAGKPNTKVSWTIHAQRNDPTLQYYDQKGGNYSSAEQNKKPHQVGKYYTPEAYGKDKTLSIYYNKEREKNYTERNLKPQKINLNEKKEQQDINSTELTREKKEMLVSKK